METSEDCRNWTYKETNWIPHILLRDVIEVKLHATASLGIQLFDDLKEADFRGDF